MRLESSIGDGFLVKMQGYQDGPGGSVSERPWIVSCLGGRASSRVITFPCFDFQLMSGVLGLTEVLGGGCNHMAVRLCHPYYLLLLEKIDWKRQLRSLTARMGGGARWQVML